MKPQGPILAVSAGVLFLILAWIGCYLLGSSRWTEGAKYRSVADERLVPLYAPLAKAESVYAGYVVCLYSPSQQFLPRPYF